LTLPTRSPLTRIGEGGYPLRSRRHNM
jgi:hypothetical protein